ncbi:hypothetical protein AAFN46_11220 [Pseudomonas sp. CAU 1711]|uniref:hypothetical protein n=1 Tax=Pseudomonas sp. CAU 1711 TaxID=3140356 RepID=UPI003260ADC7
MDTESAQRAYPYADTRLRLSWHGHSARLVIAAALLATTYATCSHGLPLHRFHLLVLHVWLPCLLAVLLTIAPDPLTLGGRAAKRAIALGTGLSVLLPAWQPVLILCTPLLLAMGAAINLSQERHHVA